MAEYVIIAVLAIMLQIDLTQLSSGRDLVITISLWDSLEEAIITIIENRSSRSRDVKYGMMKAWNEERLLIHTYI